MGFFQEQYLPLDIFTNSFCTQLQPNGREKKRCCSSAVEVELLGCVVSASSPLAAETEKDEVRRERVNIRGGGRRHTPEVSWSRSRGRTRMRRAWAAVAGARGAENGDAARGPLVRPGGWILLLQDVPPHLQKSKSHHRVHPVGERGRE